eukprot:scaffold421402_cov48-Attheya_sp.AAC.4
MFNDLRGNMVPDVPLIGSGAPPMFGEISGYRFIVMERMEAPLANVIPMLVEEQRKKKNASIPLGELAMRMVDCIEAVHERFLLFVDVKPENFMLSASAKSKSRKIGDIVNLVRMIDFGLVESFRDVTGNKQRENMHPDAPLVGTPVYASLNIHQGHTPSRRDDLEALGYVISELLLQVISLSAADKGGSAKGGRSKKASSALPTTLPWNECKSDDEILRIKLKELNGEKGGELFSNMCAGGNEKAGAAMKKYFSAVRKYNYTEKPDYEELRCILKKVQVVAKSTPVVAKTSAHAKDASVSTSSKRERRTTRSDSSKKDSSPISHPERNVKRGKIMKDESSDDEFHSVQEMDWEPEVEDRKPPATSGSGEGILVDVIEGPHQGESFLLEQGGRDCFVVGKKPSASRSDVKSSFRLSNESSISTSHVQLTLNVSSRGNVFSVEVRDLESSSGTLFNGKKIPKGKTRQAFIGDKIQIGNSILVLKQKRAVIEVDDAVMEVDENMLTNVVTIDSSPESSPICDKKVAKTTKGSDGITIFIQEGPHKGDTFFLDRQGTHTCNVGRQPPISRSKVISTFSLEHDSSVSSSHTKLVLNSGRVYSVQVKDLNSSEGTFVNGKLVPKGGSRQAFIGDKIKIGNSVMQVVGL